MSAPVITYRGPGPWGAGYGSDLSALQFDTNNWNIYNSFVQLFATSLSKQIAYTAESNGELFVHYTDHSIDGPFPLPVAAFNWRGTWQANTLYNINDIVQFANNVYVAVMTFTSGSSFAVTDNTSHTLLQLMFNLTLATSVFTVTTTTFTPDTSYLNSYIRCTSASGCAVTVAPFSSFAAPISSELQFRDATHIHGGGGIQFTAGAGVTINKPENKLMETAGEGHTVFLKNVAQNVWDLGGGLASV